MAKVDNNKFAPSSEMPPDIAIGAETVPSSYRAEF